MFHNYIAQTGNIIVLYILIFNNNNNNWEPQTVDNRLKTLIPVETAIIIVYK